MLQEHQAQQQEYERKLQRLRDYLEEQEQQRRVWAGEKWGHPGGRLYKLLRVLIPIFTIYFILSAVLYCGIREAQAMIQQTGGLSYEADISYVELYTTGMIVLCIAAVAGNVLLFLKKIRLGSVIAGGAVLLASLHILTQLFMPMPNDQYKIVFGVSLIVYVVLIAMCAALFWIVMQDRRNLRMMTENTLQTLSRGSEGLLQTEDYCRLIDEFLAAEQQKQSERANRKRRHLDED